MSDYDALLRVFDTSERLGRKIVSWGWADGRRTVTPTEHEEMKELFDEVDERLDPDAHDHGTEVARVWMNGEEIDRVEWVDL